MATNRDALDTDPRVERRTVRRIALASLIGTTIEWYDFYVYSTAASLVFGGVFFPTYGHGTGTLLAFGTYAAGSVARPLGAIVFGHVGDRVGRKAVLIVTLTMMGVCTVLIGLLPGYASIGVAAPVLLTVLRFLQSFGVGGEWGGAVLIAVEHAPRRHRVFYGSFPQTSSSLALMISTGVFAVLAVLSPGQMDAWGWRVPFLLSAPLIVIGFLVRRRVEESPEFTRLKRDEKRARVPLAEVLRGHWRALLLAVGAVLITISGFYLASEFMIFYGTDQHLFSRADLLNGVTFTGLVSVVATPIAGLLGDRYGVRKVVNWGVGAGIVFSFPMFWLTNTGAVAPMWLGMTLVMVTSSIAYGGVSTLIASWFPARVRNTGISVAYQLSGVLGGGLAPVAATALYQASHPPYLLVAVFLVVMGAISLASVLLYRGRDHFTPAPAAA
ncbi:MAG TPA: MFS transporter [Streptosporangiaceae bacterium]|jgi:MFS family permease